MANRVIGEASFDLGGKKYTLCFNNDALVQLEDQLDRGIVAITSEVQLWTKEPERIRLKWIRALLWAGLRKHHPNMSIEDAGELIEQSDATTVLNAVGDAMQKAFGSSVETKSDRPTNGASSTGTGTGSSQTSLVSDTPLKASGSLPQDSLDLFSMPTTRG